MTTLLKSKRPPVAEPDLTALTSLDDVPAVAQAATAARAAQVALDELTAKARVLNQRVMDADRYVQMQATIELSRLAPELHLAEARAGATRRAWDEARETAVGQVLDARREEYARRLRATYTKYVIAESEAAHTLEWLHSVATITGYAAVNGWFTAMPAGLTPGGAAEWAKLLPGHLGITIEP